MSCLITNTSEEVKAAIRHNRLDYEEMRQRLLETEKKLQNLNRLEAEIGSVSSVSDHHTLTNPAMRGREYHVEDLEHEDLESVPSAISTVPGSYTGFTISTPNRYEINKSHNNKAAAYSGFDSDTSTSSNHNLSKYDIKLLKQNQRLLNEVERLIGDIHVANQKNAHLVKDAEKGKSVAELEDKVVGLVAENRSQDKALRAAEQHLDEGQRRIADLQKRLNQSETELVDVRAEWNELKLVKKEVESQRDEALHNLNSTQDSLEDYQKKTQERIRKLEENEDKLQEDLMASNQERDYLLDQLSSMEMSLSSQQAQINRLLDDVTSEDARAQEFEAANQDLKTQLDLMTAQISELEKTAREIKEVKRDRNYLACELKDHRAMAHDMRALLQVLHTNNITVSVADDSGNFSVKSWPVESGMGDGRTEGGLLAAELNCNNNGLGACEPGGGEGSSNMVSEMRNLVTNMDCEIQRLRADLKQRDADDRTYANLRDELKVLMDKVESGVCHNRELECHVGALENDKKNIIMKLEETVRILGERDRTIQCLETRLNERSSQIVCLQEEVDERNIRISCLEQQIHELQRKVKESKGKNQDTEALKGAYARIKELESVLLCKNKSLDEAQENLAKTMRDMRSLKTDTDQQIECQNIELTHNQQEIERLKEDGESLRTKLSTCQKNSEELRKMNRVKDEKIGCLGNEVDELNYAKDKMEKLLSAQLEDCEKRLKGSQDQCNDLENSLAICRNEVCEHLNTMDQIRATFESEIEQRDACIRKLKEDLRRTVEELKCKMEDNNSLEHSVAELRNKLQQMCCQLKEADNSIQCLNIKIQEMDKMMLKEKSAWMKESEELERRLAQACNNLGVANNEIETLKLQLQEKKNQNDCLQNDKTHLCQELKSCGDKVCCLQEQVKKMEADNQELCRQLQQKMECIRDMENLIRVKDQELKCLTKFIQELKAQDKGDAVEKLRQEVRELKEQLDKCREENQCKSTMLCECEEAFKRCQLISKDKDNEIQLLKCQIDSLNSKLIERIARVEELERGIENLHKDVERRMMRVDEQLKKYETELVDRVQEIADLKECVNTCQLNLDEKVNELHQHEQKICLLSGELQSLNLKLKDAEDTRDHLSSQLGEKKGEVADLTQQLRLNREQMQKQHDDLVQCRSTLSCTQRDADKLRRELDDSLASLEHRECEISRLNDERKCLMEKVSQLTCKLEQETTMLQQQLAETKCRMDKEMECLRNYSCQLENNNTSVSQKLSLTQRQMLQMERCFHQKLENLSRDVDDLNTKLTVRDDEILSYKDMVALKDSEISRLKRKLCGCDKPPCPPCNAKDTCHSNNVMYDEVLSGEETDDDEDGDGQQSYKQDEMVLESRSKIDLVSDQNDKMTKEDDPEENRLSMADLKESPPDLRLSSPSDSSSTRNSLGVNEVQERLRNNQLRQREIERQLQSLEEVAQDTVGEQGEEER